MKNGARYVVTTHWGTFSLDEGSYQDYLAGKLWICWTPGKPSSKPIEDVPSDVSDKAIALRDRADRIGLMTVLSELDLHEATVPYSARIADLSVDELNLTVRSSNGLKRAGIHTFAQLKERMETEKGLANLRNIGTKSIKEIKQLFFEECYVRLLPYEKAQYCQEALDNNCTI